MRPSRRSVLFAIALAMVAARAAAHAFLDHASPAVGSTLRVSPPELRLWFTQELELPFSRVKVEDANGTAVAASDKAVDASDRSLLRISLPPLAPGTYRVLWHVLSVDSHVTEGDYTFVVAP